MTRTEHKGKKAQTSPRVCLLRLQLNSLQNENSNLKWQGANSLVHPQEPQRRAPPRGGRAMSMYETGSGMKHYHAKADGAHPEPGSLTLQPLPPGVSAIDREHAMLDFVALSVGFFFFFLSSL